MYVNIIVISESLLLFPIVIRALSLKNSIIINKKQTAYRFNKLQAVHRKLKRFRNPNTLQNEGSLNS
jgi:hypothetical protein